jgi:hypothetical protein
MPFEAAEFDTPCLFASAASLREVLPPEAATLIPWDAAASADATLRILRDPEVRAELLERVRRAGERFSWGDTGERLVEVYRATLARPIRHEAMLARDAEALAADGAEIERKYVELLEGMNDDGRQLVGSGGLLTPEQQRTLRVALEHPGSRGVVLRALALGRRLRNSDQAPIEEPATPQEEFALHWWEDNQQHVRALKQNLPVNDP